MTYERRVNFHPAYDKRDPNPSKNYGISSMRIRFVLIGPKGAVQWLIGTNWDVTSARNPVAYSFRNKGKPDSWDLGYHSFTPRYDGQYLGDCDLLEGGKCYYDGSGLNAELLIENFISQGDAYVWAALEAYYRSVFEGDPWPFDKDGNIIGNIQ